eukprot:scaffold27152_cov85-Cyclotella_meneghiniana.AAC.3
MNCQAGCHPVLEVQLIVGYRLKWESVYDPGEDAGLGYSKLLELFHECTLRPMESLLGASSQFRSWSSAVPVYFLSIWRIYSTRGRICESGE